ncbi:hypothetical protein AA21291_1213 [Swaminathania salitolerans LMG 21291]|uniref:Uncharacterized protein n=1 Tax=Swaminathania salitolerans TaxID=182838 RepID=A0A511BRW5_9PROT|nr:hypothetical protein AA21291_1213 [Swaminathania salitolerans LMG 21291]GEL03081.1 hypothetical protein SSA02_22440 [Swaminathania salitolerans]
MFVGMDGPDCKAFDSPIPTGPARQRVEDEETSGAFGWSNVPGKGRNLRFPVSAMRGANPFKPSARRISRE